MLSKWFLISLLALEIQNISAGNYIRSYIPGKKAKFFYNFLNILVFNYFNSKNLQEN